MKVIKYPQIEDYRLGVVELDEKEYINMRMLMYSFSSSSTTPRR